MFPSPAQPPSVSSQPPLLLAPVLLHQPPETHPTTATATFSPEAAIPAPSPSTSRPISSPENHSPKLQPSPEKSQPLKSPSPTPSSPPQPPPPPKVASNAISQHPPPLAIPAAIFPPPPRLHFSTTTHPPPPAILPKNWPEASLPTAAYAGIVAACVILFAVALLLLWSLRIKRQQYQKQHPDSNKTINKSDGGGAAGRGASVSEGNDQAGPSENWVWRCVGNKCRFRYEELWAATGGFPWENLVGEGGFGFVFRGELPDGQLVAVKRLKSAENRQAERQFQAEVEMLSRVHHRHLVSLLGYCIAGEQRLLVYEYVPNGTLEQHLHGNGKTVLDWPTRVKIAVGAARGLAYLHEDCHPQIIHCDIKSSNILLDYDFNARVSDFGLAKLVAEAYGHVTTHVIGTFGYLAPDYALSGKLTEKSDVYSFGVLLLELVTGRRPVDTSQASGSESLVEWGCLLLEKALMERDFRALTDPRLGERFDRDEMFRMMEVIAACLHLSSRRRPKMGQVVRVLEKNDGDDPCLSHHHGEGDEDESLQQVAFARIFNMMARGDHKHLVGSLALLTRFNQAQASPILQLGSHYQVAVKYLQIVSSRACLEKVYS